MSKENEQTEWHFPGHNYLGPGTKVATRIIRGDQPVNIYDKLARQHDIDYLRTDITQYEADNKMVRAAAKFEHPLDYLAYTPSQAIDLVFSLGRTIGGFHGKKDDQVADYLQQLISP